MNIMKTKLFNKEIIKLFLYICDTDGFTAPVPLEPIRGSQYCLQGATQTCTLAHVCAHAHNHTLSQSIYSEKVF